MTSSGQEEKQNDGLPPALERWPDGRVLTKRFRIYAQPILDMTVRDTDVWIATFLKSGTTWAQEIVWLLINNLDFATAKRVPLTQRSRFLEFPTITATATVGDINLTRWMEKFEKSTEPKRLIKTHLMWSRLPKQLQRPDSKAKIIYVARNPKDAFLSYYHFLYQLGEAEQVQMAGDFDKFVNRVLNDQVVQAPYWLHIKDYWNRRHQPNLLFLWYEDMKKDLAKEIDKIIKFLEVPYPSPDQMRNLLDHVGGWKEEMTPEISARFDAWIIKNTAGTDLEEYYKDQIGSK